MLAGHKLTKEEYKRLYLQNAHMLAIYQDEVVPGMRKEIERLKKEAERPGCEYCQGATYTDQLFAVTTQLGCKRMVKFHYCPCCGKKLEESKSRK